MLKQKISRWLGRRGMEFPKDWEVKWSNDGFVFRCQKVEGATPCFSVRWADVDAVDAFQIDLFTIDAVVLEFTCGDQTYEVIQDTQGWEQFATAMTDHLTGIAGFHSWYRLVTRKAFEENRERIYSREREAQQVVPHQPA
jgi:hypothetical protein